MLPKYEHEIRDPIHTFIRVSSDERRVIDSRAFQRLRNIHQLALTFLVYPGATHRRFEHCLGVMDLAGRIFDVITRYPRHPDVQQLFPSDKELDYWRTVVRMGALCHDPGHIPFSHGPMSGKSRPRQRVASAAEERRSGLELVARHAVRRAGRRMNQ